MTYCSRCGGILNAEKQTVISDGDKHYHYYCSWKNWEEHKARLMKGDDHASSLWKHRVCPTLKKDIPQ
jgi:hypothetical protein